MCCVRLTPTALSFVVWTVSQLRSSAAAGMAISNLRFMAASSFSAGVERLQPRSSEGIRKKEAREGGNGRNGECDARARILPCPACGERAERAAGTVARAREQRL